MAKVKFKLNYGGVRELLTGSEMRSILKEHADRAKAQLGSGYEVEISETEGVKRRAKARISAVSARAKKENLDNNTLLKAIGR